MKHYSAIEVKDLLVLATALGNLLGASLVGQMVKNLPANAGAVGGVGSIPGLGRAQVGLWSRRWQSVPLFLLGKFHGQRRQAGYSLSLVQFSHSVVSDSLKLRESQHTRPPCPSPTHVHWSVMPSNHLILCFPLLLLLLIFPIIRIFSNESSLHIRWPKC